MFPKLENLLKNLQSLSIKRLMQIIFDDKEVRQLIIDLNTKDQLFKKGIDSTGRRLDAIGGPYKYNTIHGTLFYPGKLQLGLPVDHITLFNKGEFYKSWQLHLSGTDIEITVNPFKEDDQGKVVNLFNRWGSDVVGLTEESLEKVRDLIRIKLPELLLSELRKAA